ncbi:MAG: formyltransferase family protein [Candidatus Paceibacteria bacterium]
MQGALFFYHKDALAKEVRPNRPIGILFLTSLRDIVAEEFNGQYIKVDDTPIYMQGVVEKTMEETRPGGVLHQLVEVKGVIYDDTENDFQRIQAKRGPRNFGMSPRVSLLEKDRQNILPFAETILPQNKIWNIPSTFRTMSKDDLMGRKKAKFEFEQQVLAKAHEAEADVIISDSYMAIIGPLVKELGMYGRVLNIHPGPALRKYPFCFRGKDPIGDAIKFAKQHDAPVYTGATLHMVNNGIDDGDPIAYICNTPIYDEDDEIVLMVRNYREAKLPLFVAGLRHYILQIYPHL